jgi:hypothetical protein
MRGNSTLVGVTRTTLTHAYYLTFISVTYKHPFTEGLRTCQATNVALLKQGPNPGNSTWLKRRAPPRLAYYLSLMSVTYTYPFTEPLRHAYCQSFMSVTCTYPITEPLCTGQATNVAFFETYTPSAMKKTLTALEDQVGATPTLHTNYLEKRCGRSNTS